MKSVNVLKTLAFGLSLLATTQVLAAFELDGKTFCRTIPTGGMFGQPVGERQHCVGFKNGIMTDNANTFFGNPPENIFYELVDNTNVVVVRGSKSYIDYQYQNDTLVNDAGAVLNLKKATCTADQ